MANHMIQRAHTRVSAVTKRSGRFVHTHGWIVATTGFAAPSVFANPCGTASDLDPRGDRAP